MTGDEKDVTRVALLADGEACRPRPWRTSQRTVQRALVALEADGRVRSLGQARARRWLAPPLSGFTTSLLLPATLAAA